MQDPHVKAIAQRHRKTSSQVLHRWLLQLGAAVIPRSTKRARITENGDLFSFALSEADMRQEFCTNGCLFDDRLTSEYLQE